MDYVKLICFVKNYGKELVSKCIFVLYNYSKWMINCKLSYYINSLCYCKYSIMYDGIIYIVYVFLMLIINKKLRDYMFYNCVIICEILNWIELWIYVWYFLNGLNVIVRDCFGVFGEELFKLVFIILFYL